MFALRAVWFALLFCLAAHVTAYPMPMPLRRTLSNRLGSMDLIPAYTKRADSDSLIAIPGEVPTMTPKGVLEEFSNQKRAEFYTVRIDTHARAFTKRAARKRADLNTIPAEVPTMAPESVLEEFHNDKRADLDTIPADLSTMVSTGGVLEEFQNNDSKKRADLNTIPAEVPTMSPAGVLEEFFNGNGNA